jgi:hypothetical protein
MPIAAATPEASCRRQPANGESLPEDGPGSQKADPGHDLGRDASRIDVAARPGEAVSADNREERRAQRDQEVRAGSSGAVVELAVEPDGGAERGGDDQPKEDVPSAERHVAAPVAAAITPCGCSDTTARCSETRTSGGKGRPRGNTRAGRIGSCSMQSLPIVKVVQPSCVHSWSNDMAYPRRWTDEKADQSGMPEFTESQPLGRPGT